MEPQINADVSRYCTRLWVLELAKITDCIIECEYIIRNKTVTIIKLKAK